MMNANNPSQQRLADSDMTVSDLQDMVNQLVEAKLNALGQSPQPQKLAEPTAETWQNILKNILPAIPGTPSPLELLQQERDEWYRNSS